MDLYRRVALITLSAVWLGAELVLFSRPWAWEPSPEALRGPYYIVAVVTLLYTVLRMFISCPRVLTGAMVLLHATIALFGAYTLPFIPYQEEA